MARKVKRAPKSTAKSRTQKPHEGVGQSQVSRIQSLPLDVIFEIFGRFELPGLFNFAFVSKDFRSMVLNKRNATLWSTAWRNTEPTLPPCPESISILAVAAFLFLPTCHECGKEDSHFMFWDLRARFCQRCAETLGEEHVNSGTKVYDISNMPRRYKTVAEMLRPNRPRIAPDIAKRKFSDIFRVWSAPTHETLFIVEEHWRKGVLRDEITKLRALLSDLPDEARTNYLVQRATTLEQWRGLIPSLQEVHQNWTEIQLDNKRKVQEARYTSIVERLDEIGWGEEWQKMDAKTRAKFDRLPDVVPSRPLEQDDWEPIQRHIVRFLEKAKSERLPRERTEAIQQRLEAFSSSLISLYDYRPGEPTELDIALGIPEVRNVVLNQSAEPLGKDAFEWLRKPSKRGAGKLETFIKQWKADRDAHLAKLIRDSLPAIDPKTDPLSLAIACAFSCTNCHQDVCHPPVHRCSRDCIGLPLADGLTYRDGDDSEFYQNVEEVLTGACWRPHHFHAVVDRILPFVEKCGLDPALATSEDMDRSPIRFSCKCKVCRSGGHITVMNWYAAFCHVFGRYGHRHPKKIYTLSKEHADAARQAEKRYADYLRERPRYREAFCCARCPQMDVVADREESIKAHLKSSHEVAEPVEGEDYWSNEEKAWAPQPRSVQVHLLRKGAGPLVSLMKWAFENGFATYFESG